MLLRESNDLEVYIRQSLRGKVTSKVTSKVTFNLKISINPKCLLAITVLDIVISVCLTALQLKWFGNEEFCSFL